MPMVIGIRFTNSTPFDFNGGRGAASMRVRRWLNELQKRTMRAVGQKWFDEIFPLHFTAGNKTRYQFEPRKRDYLLTEKRQEGVGKGRNPHVLQVWKGESERAMVHLPPRITGTANRVVVRPNQPPAYFRNPFIGERTVQQEVRGKDGRMRTLSRTFTVRRQPDKVAEVSQISRRDEIVLRRFAFESMRPALRSINRKVRRQTKTIR